MTHASSGILLDEEEALLPGLTRGEAGELALTNRRRFPRIPPPPAASLRLHHGAPARLLDLGLGGALVEASTRLVPGGLTGVTLTVGDVDMRARARIRRASISGTAWTTPGVSTLLYRAGLSFSLAAIPEPTGVSMLLAGMILAGCKRGRRKTR